MLRNNTGKSISPEEFVKQHDFLICVDSDGCAVDTMDIKHFRCFGLLPLVDVMMCQDVGSKAHCIQVMLEKGYQPDHVLMCGDAPGDQDAAKQNGVYYYPILVRHERESWEEFPRAAERLLDETYGPYGEKKAKEFIENLSKK